MKIDKQRFFFCASLLRPVLETLSFYAIFPVPEDFEFSRFFPCAGDFEFLRYFPGTGDFEFERKIPVLGFSPVLETLSLSKKSLYRDFPRYWRL